MAKKKIPVVVNMDMEEALNSRADAIVSSFQTRIYPLLLQFGLLDDKHVEKYLACDTVEAIYKDALTENPSSIYALRQQALLEELKDDPKERKDVWSIFRGSVNEVKNPEEEGFIFKAIPGADSPNRNTVLKALTVKRLAFTIDRDLLKEASIVHPTDEQNEVFNMLSEFCEAYNKKNFSKKYRIERVLNLKGGELFPNVRGILGKTWIYLKEKGESVI